MIRLMGQFFSKIARRFLPDAFIFAIILTLLTFILGLTVERASFMEMTSYFGAGLWDLLDFSMQMVLILVTGSALATSNPVQKLLKSLARLAHTPTQAIVLACLAMMVGCWLNWGFGLIVSALLAKELAQNVKGVHYPLLVAAAYSGFIVWHAGFSGSIPLKIAGADDIMQQYAQGAVVSTSQTIFAWQNLLLVVVFLAAIPLINFLMAPKNKTDIIEVDPKIFEPDSSNIPPPPTQKLTCAQRLENSSILSLAVGVVGVVYIIHHFRQGNGLNLNIVNFIFLILGIILHKTPIRYVRAVNQAVKTCGPIILQFPFYAGIMGMMINSGLAVTLSRGFVAVSNQTTFPFFTFLSAGLVNFFVPSGGGQWAVQGPIMMPAAQSLNVPYSTTAMAIAWGDAWTNLVQPFWALPLLAVAKLNIRDIMGYTAVVLIFSGLITSLFMLLVF
ncbi:MAG: short-chain fatty acid transporter [Phycisphaerae bacterium SM23_30]|nr:MAG: short-chain fatty acid transporter [Phycisphaerae bacterium SM23_30]